MAIWVVGMFLPVSIGNLAVIGFGFGLALRAILPYYMAWKQNEEALVFNYAYLMPIVILVATAVGSGIAGVTEYLTLVLDTSSPYLIYAGATVFAYGGYDLFNGFRKWWPFLEQLWETKQLNLEEMIRLATEEAPAEEPVEETPVPVEEPPVVEEPPPPPAPEGPV